MDGIGASLAGIHGWIALAAAVLAAALVVAGGLDWLGAGRTRRLADRLILALLVATIAAALLGPAVALGDAPPRDPLHLLYAAVAVIAAPLLRAEAARRGSARPGAWVAAGGVVTLGTLLRLWMTG